MKKLASDSDYLARIEELENREKEHLSEIEILKNEVRLLKVSLETDSTEAIIQSLLDNDRKQESQIKAVDMSMCRVEFDTNGKVLTANEKFIKISGIPIEKLADMHHSDFMSEEKRCSAEYKDFWKNLTEGQIHQGGHQYFFNGKECWMFSSFVPIINIDGDCISVLALLNDISKVRDQQKELTRQAEELLAAEEELRQNIEELNAVQENLEVSKKDLEIHMDAIDSASGRLEFDSEGIVIFVNQRFLDIAGVPQELITGCHHSDFMSLEAKKSEGFKNFWRELNNGKSQKGGHQYFFDGKERWMFGSFVPIINKNGKCTSVLALFNDISKVREQQKQLTNQAEELLASEEELKQSFEELNTIKECLEVSKSDLEIHMQAIDSCMGRLEFDMDGNVLYANDLFLSIAGVGAYSIIGQHHSSFMSEEKKLSKEYSKFWSDLQNGKLQKGGHQYFFDGNEKWMFSTFMPVISTEGSFKSVLGLFNDISKVREQEQRINQQIVEIKEQKELTEAHRDIVLKQNEDIVSSINYARRIQNGILPERKQMSEYFLDHFILYKPKDIVSGDFYLATKVANQLIVTVADCTGHGVPGALMSMLGVSFLNEIIRKKDVTQANHVLNHLRNSVIEALQERSSDYSPATDGHLTEGMDLSLCVIDSETKKMQFSGANNPIYIIRKADTAPVLEEIKGDNMPAAIHIRMDEFTNHEFQVKEGDQVYLFSDGYADQFGGTLGELGGKKFKYQPFKKLLLENSHKTMSEQKEILEKTLNEWMKPESQDDTIHEQVDDITVLGIKI